MPEGILLQQTQRKRNKGEINKREEMDVLWTRYECTILIQLCIVKLEQMLGIIVDFFMLLYF